MVKWFVWVSRTSSLNRYYLQKTFIKCIISKKNHVNFSDGSQFLVFKARKVVLKTFTSKKPICEIDGKFRRAVFLHPLSRFSYLSEKCVLIHPFKTRFCRSRYRWNFPYSSPRFYYWRGIKSLTSQMLQEPRLGDEKLIDRVVPKKFLQPQSSS